MLTISPIFIIAIVAVMAFSQPLHNDSEMKDNADHTRRVKRQWGDWYSYKFKTPFYKMKIRTPFPYGGNMHPFGGGYGYRQFGYHPGGYGPIGFLGGYGPMGFHSGYGPIGYYPSFHSPNLFGWNSWI
ncbi:Serrate RNA effector molecule [Dirofilaria immitis]